MSCKLVVNSRQNVLQTLGKIRGKLADMVTAKYELVVAANLRI
jgi:hypothetical protein